MKETIELQDKEIKRLKKQLAHTEDMCKSANSYIRELESRESTTSESIVNALKKDNNNFKEDINKLSVIISSLRNELAQYKERYNNIKRSNSEYVDELAKAYEERAELNKKLIKLKEVLNVKYGDIDYKEKYEDCQKYLELVSKERDRLAAENNTLKTFSEINTLKRRLSRAEDILRTVKEKSLNGASIISQYFGDE
jgi:chromosome segregation ATPase